jgi:Lrp/AsnC family transcriptional regulator for asnA, asnC and gidA
VGQNRRVIATPLPSLVPNYRPSLDDVDRRLIDLLVENGRAGASELAFEVELSDDAVRERLRRLIDGGVVTVVGSVSPTTVGLSVTALVGMKLAGPVAPVAASLAAIPHVDFVVSTAGGFDLLVELVAPSHEHVAEMLDDRIRTIPEIQSLETFLYLSVEKWTHLADPQAEAAAGEIEGDERLIIDALRVDGRLSYRALAERTGLNYATARRKAIALIDSGVVKITTNVNRTATGDNVSAAVAVCVDGPLDPALAELRAFDEVSVIAVCAGRFDMFLDVATTSTDAMRHLVFDRIRACPGVRSTETFHYLGIHKLPFSWMFPDPAR